MKSFELTPSELEVFDEKQREIVLRLQEGMKVVADGAVDQAVSAAREEFGTHTTLERLISDIRQALRR